LSLAGGWEVERDSGTATELHRRSAEHLDDPRRTVRILEAQVPTLVLGSHQDARWFDTSALQRAGVSLARRTSGGSAVLVGPGRVIWVDFVLPAGDPLWDDDVVRAARWVGELWAGAVGLATGLRAGSGSPAGRSPAGGSPVGTEAPGAGAAVWTGPMRHSPFSPAVCFAGLAPGEVTLHGRKVVGVSQRRTRRGALFQTAALLRWTPGEYLDLLACVPGDPAGLELAAKGLLDLPSSGPVVAGGLEDGAGGPDDGARALVRALLEGLVT
jgi:lipoate-protein ligase A